MRPSNPELYLASNVNVANLLHPETQAVFVQNLPERVRDIRKQFHDLKICISMGMERKSQLGLSPSTTILKCTTMNDLPVCSPGMEKAMEP